MYSVRRLNRIRINRIFAYNGDFWNPKIHFWSKSRQLKRISAYNGENGRSRALRYKRRTLYFIPENPVFPEPVLPKTPVLNMPALWNMSIIARLAICWWD